MRNSFRVGLNYSKLSVFVFLGLFLLLSVFSYCISSVAWGFRNVSMKTPECQNVHWIISRFMPLVDLWTESPCNTCAMLRTKLITQYIRVFLRFWRHGINISLRPLFLLYMGDNLIEYKDLLVHSFTHSHKHAHPQTHYVGTLFVDLLGIGISLFFTNPYEKWVDVCSNNWLRAKK